ncbi:Uncharacterized protein PECH_001807 [Penicillium ucsense]|uniref:Uncharacterized protein n=1 Tax=Penicillium ucsense TaxID=2839758 RepID=A0A8J8WJT2_9EURO|nr:Uncharacterized protein PECM_008105 [Penicillium ucsense]KAF7738154.1 Uncharacterized protein PECH_001807 [Penicillium ucsense]
MRKHHRRDQGGQLDRIEGDVDEDSLVNGTAQFPKNEEFETALKVPDYLQADESVSLIKPTGPLVEVVGAIRVWMSLKKDTRLEYAKQARRARRCYVCRQKCSILNVHNLYPSLCSPCGGLQPGVFTDISAGQVGSYRKTAPVTGGRINLGYHTALRLLGCGASVMMSSRYPADAADQYSKETRFHTVGIKAEDCWC